MSWNNDSSNSFLDALPANGGIGFNSWSSSKSPNTTDSGFNLGDSTLGGGNINDGIFANAFYVYGYNTSSATAIRPIANTLSEVGDYLTFKFTINYRNGQKGVRLLDNSNNLIYLFQCVEGIPVDYFEVFTTAGGYSGDLGWGYSGSAVYTLRATRLASSTDITVSRTVDVQSITRNISESVSKIEFFCQNTDNADAQNNLYFNSLSTTNPYR